MIEIVTQPKWAFWKYEEVYRFASPLNQVATRDRVVDFFSAGSEGGWLFRWWLSVLF